MPERSISASSERCCPSEVIYLHKSNEKLGAAPQNYELAVNVTMFSKKV